jgi:hypothetical protein
MRPLRTKRRPAGTRQALALRADDRRSDANVQKAIGRTTTSPPVEGRRARDAEALTAMR